MKTEYTDSFVDSSIEIIEQVSGSSVTKDGVSVKDKLAPLYDIFAMIGVTGDANGRILIEMDEKTGLGIASAMNGEKLKNFDTLVKETLTELANMIAGKAITNLHAKGFKFQITPPSLLTGKEMTVLDLNSEIMEVVLKTGLGIIRINIALREK